MRLKVLATACTFAVFAILVTIGITALGVSPAQAQEDCVNLDRCEALRGQVRGYRQDGRELRREMRQLRIQLRDLPEDSPEREAIREQIRGLRDEARRLRRQARTTRREIRENCRGCFGEGSPKDS
jgi:chromosome segregation ATPase